jgi:hypothetical protein
MSFMPPDEIEVGASMDMALGSPVKEQGGGGDNEIMEAAALEEEEESEEEEDSKRARKQMHSAIVDYLKGLTREQKATVEDIHKELGINLNKQQYVLDMIKSNPKVEVERRYIDDVLFFKYRQKFEINNKSELLWEIDRVSSGISMKEITNPPCYPGVEEDCHNMIVGGEIIAVKNKEFKAVLFPRGQPFITRLTGDVEAYPGAADLATTADLRREIRRGDAIRIGMRGDWYRISSAAPSGRELDRQTAPLSVTSEREMSEKNVYRDDFDERVLPLDGDYEGNMPGGEGEDEDGVYTGGAYRHGCANNIRGVWGETLPDLKKIVSRANNPNSNAIALRKELVALKLVSNQASTEAGVNAKKSLQRARSRDKVKKKRKYSERAGTKSFNEHLKGSALEQVMKKTAVS